MEKEKISDNVTVIINSAPIATRLQNYLLLGVLLSNLFIIAILIGII
jgi:hypothetical protein